MSIWINHLSRLFDCHKKSADSWQPTESHQKIKMSPSSRFRFLKNKNPPFAAVLGASWTRRSWYCCTAGPFFVGKLLGLVVFLACLAGEREFQ
jgi:hypothetical protein